jgi:hypothetical protein
MYVTKKVAFPLLHFQGFASSTTTNNLGYSLMKQWLLVCAILCLSIGAFAQQSYVPRYDAFTGFSYLDSPKMNLAQRGFNGEFGVNVNRWLALGVDYSVFTGPSSLLPSELDPSIQAQLAGFPLPPGYALSVPFDARTQTISAGPQVNIRKLQWVTFFVRPALGILHEQVTARPSDPIQTAVVGALVPSGKKSDTTIFYGFGGGFDINASKHVAFRFASDFVHVNLFDGFLKEGRNSVRVSVGPTYHWGKNVE